jgi:hypothetical protein
MSQFQGTVAQSELNVTCLAQVLSFRHKLEERMHKMSGVELAWIQDEVETKALNTT